MDSLRDLLKKKADNIDLDAKKNELELIQEVFDRHFINSGKVTKLSGEKLFIKATSSSSASKIRLGQVLFIEEVARVVQVEIKQLIIRQ